MAAKVLWIVNLNNVDTFLQQAKGIGASAVAIRTTATNFHESIPAFHGEGIKVYGWRWPPTDPDAAAAQAAHVVELIGLGLDGFILDPEESDTNPSINWNRHGLAGVAASYCDTIRAALGGGLFGTTSHYRAAEAWPALPWSTFVNRSDLVFPQAYWRFDGGTPIGTGPKGNYEAALQAWSAVGADPGTIVPMAGEIASAHPSEIAAYGAVAADHDIEQLHFYSADGDVPGAVWEAIAAL